MKIKMKCKNCSETDYVKVDNLKKAKSYKKLYKEGGYVCQLCFNHIR